MSEVPLYAVLCTDYLRGVTHLPRALLKKCRVTQLIRNRRPLGPYSRTMPRALWGP